MKYEVTIILKGNTPADSQPGREQLSKIFEKSGVKILENSEQGVKSFWHMMGKDKEGTYLYYDCEIGTDKVAVLTHDLNLANEVLRFFIVRTEIIKIKKKKADKKGAKLQS